MCSLCNARQALLVECMPTADARSTVKHAAGAKSGATSPSRSLSLEQREQLLAIQSRIQLDLIGAIGAMYVAVVVVVEEMEINSRW